MKVEKAVITQEVLSRINAILSSKGIPPYTASTAWNDLSVEWTGKNANLPSVRIRFFWIQGETEVHYLIGHQSGSGLSVKDAESFISTYQDMLLIVGRIKDVLEEALLQ